MAAIGDRQNGSGIIHRGRAFCTIARLLDPCYTKRNTASAISVDVMLIGADPRFVEVAAATKCYINASGAVAGGFSLLGADRKENI
jgi:hypothetical protein